MNEIKPGWKTSEFWLAAVAAIVGILQSSGAIGDGTQAARIVGTAAIVLASMGYSTSRAIVKKDQP